MKTQGRIVRGPRMGARDELQRRKRLGKGADGLRRVVGTGLARRSVSASRRMLAHKYTNVHVSGKYSCAARCSNAFEVPH